MKRGPKPRATFTQFEAAMIRYGLPPEGGIAALSQAWQCDRTTTMNVLAGIRPPPVAALSLPPGSLGSPSPVEPSRVIPNSSAGYALLLPSLLAPRRASVPPARSHVGFDRLVIDSQFATGAKSDALLPKHYKQTPLQFSVGGVMHRYVIGRLFSDRKSDDEIRPFRRNVNVYSVDGVTLATLQCERAFRSLPELRLELSGAAWRLGVAVALGAFLLGELCRRDVRVINEAHVAVDVEADLDDFVPFRLDARRWPTFPTMLGFLFQNNAVTSGYDWSQGGASLVVYDKIAQTKYTRAHALDEMMNAPAAKRRGLRLKANAARRTAVPLHATGWSELMRVEVRLTPRKAGCRRDVDTVLSTIRECFDGTGLADLRLLDGLDTSAFLLGQARARGFRSQRPTVAAMRRALAPRPPREKDDEAINERHSWPDFGAYAFALLRANANEETALVAARVMHKHVLEHLRQLDSRSPFRLAQLFDAHERDLRATLSRLGVA